MDLRAGEAGDGFVFLRIFGRVGGAETLNVPAGRRATEKKRRHARYTPQEKKEKKPWPYQGFSRLLRDPDLKRGQSLRRPLNKTMSVLRSRH